MKRTSLFDVRIAIILAAILATVAGGTSLLQAQTFYGSIVGTVTDATGAIVPGATVSITDIATNEKRSAQSNAAGDYSFVNLVPATYSVEVQRTQFKRFLRNQVVVEVNATVRVDAALQVGSATETVEVTTQTPLLQTDSGTLSDVVEGKTVKAMPLNGRNTMNLLALAADVVPGNYAQGSTTMNHGGHTDSSYWDSYSIGGGMSGQGAMYVDGAPTNVLGSGTVGYVPSQDSVQEFDVSTNSTSAEFGRFSGGVINMTTKTGGNEWHGSAYEYLRNNVLNSNEFFNKQSELQKGAANKRAQWDQNQYGVVFSGPIKKDKAFFMFNWETFVARTGSLNSSLVPSSDMQKGIIDGQNLLAGSTILSTLCPSADYNVTNAGATTIPSACWDSAATVMKTMYPSANEPLSQQNNFALAVGSGTNTYTYTGRVDYDISAKQRFFGRYTFNHIQDTSANTMPGGAYNGKAWNIGGAATADHVYSGVLGDTYTFNSSTILDVRLSVMRSVNGSTAPTEGMSDSIFGTNWGVMSKTMTDVLAPDIGFNDSAWPISGFRGAFFPGHQWNDNEGVTVSLTKIVGKHSLKIGLEDRYMDRAVMSNNDDGGNISFGSRGSNRTNYTPSTWANFLLGAMDSAQFPTTLLTGSYKLYQGYYVNDTWQATRKLTVNAGLRWELMGNIKEKHDRMMELIPGLADSNGYNGSAVLVNSSAYSSQGSEPAKHDLFAPRIGLAYRLTNSDVIRGGFAINFVPPDTQSGMFADSMSMNSYTNSWSYPTCTITATNGPCSLSNPWPAGVQNSNAANILAAAPGRNGFTTSTFYQNTISGPVSSTKYPYQQQWNLSASHQFKGDVMLQVGYAGSTSVHQPMGYDYDELPSTYWTDPTTLLTNDAGNLSGSTVTSAQLSPCSSLWHTDGTTLGQCARPYMAYTGFNDALGNIGTQTYESMPVKLEKRFKSGGMISAAYAWTKILGNGTVQDWYNLKASKALSKMDVPQRVVISYVLNLPFGKGQQFLSGSNPVVQHVVSGWSVNGITTLQDGFPVAISANEPSGTVSIPASYGATLLPNLVAGCNRKQITGSVRENIVQGNAVFNAACFTAPPAVGTVAVVSHGQSQTESYATTLGNERPVDEAIKAPGIANWDFSIEKTTKITEKLGLDFRMEFFNIFNHEQFGAPGATLNASGGGGGPFGSVPFGHITSGSQGSDLNPRIGQASLRLSF